MKKVNLIAVGKLKEKLFADAAAEYTKRLNRFCQLKIVEIPDCSFDNAIKLESDAILSLSNKFWLLDIGGEQMSSKEFSKTLDNTFIAGSVTFVIGGSNGVDQRVKDAAEKKLSFGKFTYPHQLMRVMFLEQLYRAFSISTGLPYHK